VARVPAGAIFWNLYTVPTNIPKPNFTTLLANQLTNVNLESVGVSDTMSLWNKRIQLTVGVRQQTAGSAVTNYLPGGVSRPMQETSVWTPAYAIVVKPVENISLYANYIEGLQTPVVVGSGFANPGTVFPPGQTKQAEAGVKIDTGRLTATMSVFDISQASSAIAVSNSTYSAKSRLPFACWAALP
jgi:iron complex outermembrane recepter protein